MISWNIEGLAKNEFILRQFADQFSCQLIFLSEPQAYRCDIHSQVKQFLGSYEYQLNSEDVFDMDLPLTHPRAKGGTMVLWHHTLSPHLKVLPSPSPSFVSVLLSLPGVLPSIHTAVYLPTAGKDGDWVATLLELEQHVIENFSKHGNIAIFLRRDLTIFLLHQTL